MMGVSSVWERWVKECWRRDEIEGYFSLEGCFMVNVDRNLFEGLKMKKVKIFMAIGVNFPF